jgi:hypothetical protein
MEGSSKYGDEPSSSMKCGKFVLVAEDVLAS